MTALELIARLEALVATDGDAPVYLFDSDYGAMQVGGAQREEKLMFIDGRHWPPGILLWSKNRVEVTP